MSINTNKQKIGQALSDDEINTFNNTLRTSPVLVNWLGGFTDFKYVLQHYYGFLTQVMSADSALNHMIDVVGDVNGHISEIDFILSDYDRYLLIINTLIDDLSDNEQLELPEETKTQERRNYFKQAILPPSTFRLLARNGGVR